MGIEQLRQLLDELGKLVAGLRKGVLDDARGLVSEEPVPSRSEVMATGFLSPMAQTIGFRRSPTPSVLGGTPCPCMLLWGDAMVPIVLFAERREIRS